MFSMAESVLIVEASDTGKFSKLLYNLMGTNDDFNGVTLGPVDGSVDASLFNEEQFAQTPLSSSQKVVFIGKPKGADDYLSVIRLESHDAVEEDGVYIGVSGKHAYIDVDNEPLTKERYWKFLDTAKEHGQDYKDLLADFRPSEDVAEPEDNETNPILGFAKVVGKVAVDGASNVGQAMAIHQRSGKIREQRYQYAVRRFYYEMLKDFVEA